MSPCAAATYLFAQRAPPAKQTEESTTKEIRQEFYAVTNNIRQAAYEMPESGYPFQPASGMRTFGALLLHVADVQSKTCRSILKDPKPRKATAASKNSKSDIQAALAASFGECYEAFSELSTQNKDTVVSTPAGDRTRLAALAMVLGMTTKNTATWLYIFALRM